MFRFGPLPKDMRKPTKNDHLNFLNQMIALFAKTLLNPQSCPMSELRKKAAKGIIVINEKMNGDHNRAIPNILIDKTA